MVTIIMYHFMRVGIDKVLGGIVFKVIQAPVKLVKWRGVESWMHDDVIFAGSVAPALID